MPAKKAHRHLACRKPSRLSGVMAKEAVRHSARFPLSGKPLPVTVGPSGATRAPPSRERRYHRPRRPGGACQCALPRLGEGAAASQGGQAAHLSARSPVLGKALLLAKEAARHSACAPLSQGSSLRLATKAAQSHPSSGEAAAAGHQGHAASRTLPHTGKVLPHAKKAARHHTHFPMTGKALPPASKATRHLMHLPMTGKALPPASKATRHHPHLPMTGKRCR
jgi:hypothetical protein